MSACQSDTESYGQGTDISLMLALAQHVAHRSFVDVGAEKGSFSRPLLDLGFHGVLIEPFAGHLPSLRTLVEGTSCRVLDLAIDETDHEGLLHIAVDAEGKVKDYFHSLIGGQSHALARHSGAVPVRCRSLSSLAQEGLIDREIGILKIDTEGNDLNVIRGMGDIYAEVLICEFVTPSLYSSWTGSFPEALVEAAGSRGYEACIAVKRLRDCELVIFDPAGFVDGQWGNLIFTSRELLRRARHELDPIAYRDEKTLVSSISHQVSSLEEKEKVIRKLARHLEGAASMLKEKEAAIQDLARGVASAAAMVEEKEKAIQDLCVALKEKEEAIQKLAVALQEKESVIGDLAAACETRLTTIAELTDEVRRLQFQDSPGDAWEHR